MIITANKYLLINVEYTTLHLLKQRASISSDKRIYCLACRSIKTPLNSSLAKN